MSLVLFCNIAYMKYYDADVLEDPPKHGGEYVTETGDALEKYNFHVTDSGIIKGFVETKYRDSYLEAKKPNSIRLENIHQSFAKKPYAEGVTVIFCAHSDVIKKTVIIGWYNNATVYRQRNIFEGRDYNILCRAEDAHLLPENERVFIVPRAQQDRIGFGQSNLWYAQKPEATSFVGKTLDYIAGKNSIGSLGNTHSEELPEKYTETGIGKKVTVNRYERNPVARLRCLEIHGEKCAVCGFNPEKVYGSEFKGKIEVHHIVPIHLISKEYKVNPETDLIPVCANCHTMLHVKLENGEFISVEELRKRVKAN